jgi:hypothetical protein
MGGMNDDRWVQVPYGYLLVNYDAGMVAHWFILQDPSRTDIIRAATKSVIASGVAQAIHEHDSGSMCTRQCQALIPLDLVVEMGENSPEPTEGQGNATEGPPEASGE